MDISVNNEQKNVQKIGAAMIHSLNVLQMNVVDLRNLILEESKRNPAIEIVDFDEKSKESDKKQEFLSNIKDKPSIEDFILKQVPDWPRDKQEILLEIIYNLDDSGFFSGNFKQIADKFGISEATVINISNELKNLQPYGLSSKNLKEALIIQTRNILSDKEKQNLIISLIKNHLQDILRGFFRKVAKSENLPVEMVQNVGHFISRLNFSPMSFFNSEYVVAIIPDVRVFKVDGNWVVEVNDEYYPQLRFSKIYRELLSKSGEDSAKAYMKECAKKVRLLSNAINKRNVTLCNIMTAILNHQKQFFEFGPKWLNGLSLKEIASDIGVNVSTVSRAILGKYADTPFGTKKISSFFDSSVNGYSATFIKTEIKKILQKSDVKLSDQKITDILKDRGIYVARRTVAKYRNEANLPNSRIRKIEKIS